jgi:PAT family beta-lactamase induction signal transducer AmpG
VQPGVVVTSTAKFGKISQINLGDAMMLSTLRRNEAWRLAMVTILGFASGLPLALSGSALQTWLTVDNVDIATIGFFSLVGLPYTFKFLWAPLMDRFEPPMLGRRRGWIVVLQALLAVTLLLISRLTPSVETQAVALMALVIAFLSASQDVVLDAYRTDILHASERGLGSSLNVFGYRMAMILSGGIAMVWADAVSGNGWSWPKIYVIMAGIMGVLAVISLLALPSVPKSNVAPKSNARHDVTGFLALVAAVVVGYLFTTKLASPLADRILLGLFPIVDGMTADPSLKKWSDLISLLAGLLFTIPLGSWASKKAKFETLNVSLANYFSMQGAVAILALIILYKLGDAFAGSLTTPFLLKGVGFSQAEIGVVNKVIGIWLTIIGALAGGVLMVRLGLYRSLMVFGCLQLLSNLGFWLVAILGKDAWGSVAMPPFDLVIVSLKEATRVDWLLVSAIGFENITGGMGTAAFVALLMALCNQKFTATQYALLSAFSAVGRVWVGPMAGVLASSLGWSTFFIFSTFAAVPGLLMLLKLKPVITRLETPEGAGILDD